MADLDYISEINKAKVDELYQKFVKLFTMKGYKPSSTFDNKVWFLKNDKIYQELLKNKTPYSNTPKPTNKVIDIIRDLNQGDIKNINISVDRFIKKICKELIDSNIAIELSDESIKKNDSLEKISKINEILLLLNGRVEGKRKGDFVSLFQPMLSSLNHFPSGPYKVTLKINTSFDKENIDELNQSERNNLNKTNPDNVFNIFKSSSIKVNSLINIPKEDDSIIFRHNTDNTNEGNYFNAFKFSILEKEGSNYLLDRRYSGSTFSNFRLCITGKEDTYESKNEYLLHLVLSWIDDLCNLNKEVFRKDLNIKVKGNKDTNEERVVGIKFIFEIDHLTRIGILNRIKELISIPVDTKVKNQLMIEEILSEYFTEIKDNVKSILEKNEEPKENCCNCIIF